MPTGHATATLNGKVIADTAEWEVVEGNVYFPPAAVRREYLAASDLHTTCAWKGEASYYTVDVDGTRLENAAWYYPSPKDKAANIRDYVAFYKNKVNITTA